MNTPDDFGLSPLGTLAHVANSTPPPGYQQFWINWNEHVWNLPVAFEGYSHAAGTPDPGVTHTLRSVRHVRIGCRLVPSSEKIPRGVVITSHGYGVGEDEPLTDDNPWSKHGLAVLKIRLRGFPGSQMDTGDLVRQDQPYITRGLETPGDWVLSDAVADLVMAFRAIRAQYGQLVPISLHGESFGGGIGIIAASQITGREELFRLIVGLPSLGDWAWRLRHRTTSGTGAEVAAFLHEHAAHEAQILENLRLFDAVVHARRVRAPAVFKLAARDEVVPAPTASAIYNALGTAPGLKWRFVVQYGHFDGGIANARRHATFENLAGDFADPQVYPQELMRRWESELNRGEQQLGEAS